MRLISDKPLSLSLSTETPHSNTRLVPLPDVPTILQLMHTTAAEQNGVSIVKATEQDLVDFVDFGDSTPQPRALGRFTKILLAVSPCGEIAGLATYFVTFAAWLGKPSVNLEDLFVLAQYRRKGYARDLMRATAAEASKLGCARIEWQCYRDNHQALRFYESLGARVMESIVYLRLDREGLISLANEDVGET